MIPTALTIAGSDSGGGAGIQADLKTFMAHGVYGMSVITAITAQNTRGVSWASAVAAEDVRKQIRAVFEDFPVGAVKIGMLANRAIAQAVAEELGGRGVAIVLDPVLISTSGVPLVSEDAVPVIRDLLGARAALITPNLPELRALGGEAWARSCGVPVLIKGGHGEGPVVEDRLVGMGPDRSWTHNRVRTRNTHGTGCTLSAAIAARMARGDSLVQAIGGAIEWVSAAIAVSANHELGDGPGPLLHHLVERRK